MASVFKLTSSVLCMLMILSWPASSNSQERQMGSEEIMLKTMMDMVKKRVKEVSSNEHLIKALDSMAVDITTPATDEDCKKLTFTSLACTLDFMIPNISSERLMTHLDKTGAERYHSLLQDLLPDLFGPCACQKVNISTGCPPEMEMLKEIIEIFCQPETKSSE
ncbi:hypothetical protein OTU49_016538 [Cherax quadricarinatus]|uniref:Uncharacterized protein n=1 Tax=Cherax quadricarinatus TaxID=27406 RepID=A0AAW0Y6L0_CHEQU